jgi:uncharacterized membrane protein
MQPRMPGNNVRVQAYGPQCWEVLSTVMMMTMMMMMMIMMTMMMMTTYITLVFDGKGVRHAPNGAPP